MCRGTSREKSGAARTSASPLSRFNADGIPNVELLRRVLTGWEMVDENRAPVPFNEQNFEAFVRLTGAVREIMLVYWKHNVGAKEKN